LHRVAYHRVVVPQGGVCMSGGPVTIRAGVFVEQGATPVLGHETIPVHTATISGGVHATNAMNVLHGSVNVMGNTVPDPDGNEIVTNTIHGNLNCAGNDPKPQGGDSEGSRTR
jgi:hypothetical protein